MTDPALDPSEREALTKQLMAARRDVGIAKRTNDTASEKDARGKVDAAKRKLGERGAVWWTDGAPDFNRHMAKNTPYAQWYALIDAST